MDFEEGVTLHLSGEELRLYQVSLQAFSSLVELSTEDDLAMFDRSAEMIEDWEQSWDDKPASVAQQFRQNPKQLWETLIKAKTKLARTIMVRP